MPYAINGQVSTDELPESIQITDEEYAAAIDGLSVGKVVIINSGHMEVVNVPSIVVSEPQTGNLDTDDLMPEKFKSLDSVDLLSGLLYLNITPDMVDAAIATMPEPDRTIAKWRWERSQLFNRDDWLIEEMATVFNKTKEEVDAAWLYASG